MRWLKNILLPRRPRIRPMGYVDIPETREMLHAAFHQAHDHIIGRALASDVLSRYDDEEAFARYFYKDDVSLLVSARGDEMCGVGLGGRLERQSFIAMLYVHPEYQRQGIGHSLLLDLLHAHPAPLVEVEIVAGNTVAQTFFSQHGFVPHRRTVSRDGVDLTVMILAQAAT